VLGACWIGILVKFWDLCQNKSKNKRKLEDGPEHVMGVDFKESKCDRRKHDGASVQKVENGYS
jgi:hypothetical protein